MSHSDVFQWSRRVFQCRLHTLSPKRHVGGRKPVGGVLLLRGGVRAGERHRLVCAVQSGEIQHAVGTHGVLELHGRAVRGELWLEGPGQLFRVPRGAVVAGGQPGLQDVSGEQCGAGGERVERQMHMRRGIHRARRRPVRRVCDGQVQARERDRRVRQLRGRAVSARARGY